MTPEALGSAERAERLIVSEKENISAGFLKIAYLLDAFDAAELYLARGYPTLRAWAQSPEIDLSYRLVHDLLRLKRELLPVLIEQVGSEQEAVNLIIKAGVSNGRALLPLLAQEDTREELSALAEQACESTYRDLVATVKDRIEGEAAIDTPGQAMFSARVRRNDTITTFDISVSDGVAVERCGTLRIPTKFVGRFERRFGDMLEVLD